MIITEDSKYNSNQLYLSSNKLNRTASVILLDSGKWSLTHDCNGRKETFNRYSDVVEYLTIKWW